MVQHRGVGEGRRTQPNRGNPTTNQRRLTAHEAARRLGISEDAVRMRVKRGTLEAEREGGRLYVLLRPDPMVEPTDRTDELIAELRERVRSLEDQLGQERHANKENRRIIAALTSRILELPAAQAPASPEPRESPPGAAEEEPARTTLPATRGPQEPVRKRARRSWWKEKYASAMVGMLTAFAVLAANKWGEPASRRRRRGASQSSHHHRASAPTRARAGARNDGARTGRVCTGACPSACRRR
jgi:excisionase family DNA binding protein